MGGSFERRTLDPRRIPGFGPEWRRDITGAWYSPDGTCFRAVIKQADTDRWRSSIQLALGSDWLDDDGASCMMNSGLHLGLPEAPIVEGSPILLPPDTGIALAAIAGPGTQDWEPTELEENALALMWTRLFRHLCDLGDYELCFVPSLVGEHPETFDRGTPAGIEATLNHFAGDLRCRVVAHFQQGSHVFEDPQLLPWGYVSPDSESFDRALAHGLSAGATGFIIQRGRSDQVGNWNRLPSPVVRLDVQLNECLLMFEVVWHGDGLVILSRQADRDDIESALEADDVVALTRRLQPREFESAEGAKQSPPWLSDEEQ